MRSPVACSLHLEHSGVDTSASHELFMIAFFDETAAFEDNDAISHADGRKTMGDQERHFTFGQFGEAFKDFEFAARIESCGGLVEYKQLCVAEVSAG